MTVNSNANGVTCISEKSSVFLPLVPKTSKNLPLILTRGPVLQNLIAPMGIAFNRIVFPVSPVSKSHIAIKVCTLLWVYLSPRTSELHVISPGDS